MGPVNEELDVLFKELKSNKRDKNQSIDFISDFVSTIVKNNVPSTEYKNVGLTVGSYIKKVKNS